MAHMVVFRNIEGKPGYHQAESIEEAVRFVEHLRNQEQVTEARIFRMQEVPIEFKTYYRVEFAAPGDQDEPDEVIEGAEPPPAPADAMAGDQQARRRFSRT